MNPGYAAVESLARDSYGRLVAYLSAGSGDVAGAEDALSEAFLAALERWPSEGLPEKPEAWLLTVARRRLIDAARHDQVHQRHFDLLQRTMETARREGDSDPDFPDERLRLLFVCAHPAIDESIRTPLMLQTVLGLDAARIASAFLTSPTTMSQRLVRAKMKIRDTKIPFDLPPKHELAGRLQSVLEAIYAAFTSGWEDAEDADAKGLVTEAIWLGKVVTNLLPTEPEALGLVALMLHCQARHPARLTAAGAYTALPDQNVQLWSEPMLREAESYLQRASLQRNPGRFQIEAAIQSVHSQRRYTGRIEWPAIGMLYGALIQLAPTIGARIGQAVALAQTQGAEAGLTLLDRIDSKRIQSHQPYWAARAHLLTQAEKRTEAAQAYQRAIGLCKNRAQREFLLRQLNRLMI